MEATRPCRSQVFHIISQFVNLHEAGQKAHIYVQVACSSRVFTHQPTSPDLPLILNP